MNQLDEIRREIDSVSERRAELWHVLAEGHDPTARDELRRLDERLQTLWDEQRVLRARLRFGDRDEIIRRARTEERLLRAA